jgi:hypothetical protein
MTAETPFSPPATDKAATSQKPVDQDVEKPTEKQRMEQQLQDAGVGSRVTEIFKHLLSEEEYNERPKVAEGDQVLVDVVVAEYEKVINPKKEKLAGMQDPLSEGAISLGKEIQKLESDVEGNIHHFAASREQRQFVCGLLREAGIYSEKIYQEVMTMAGIFDTVHDTGKFTVVRQKVTEVFGEYSEWRAGNRENGRFDEKERKIFAYIDDLDRGRTDEEKATDLDTLEGDAKRFNPKSGNLLVLANMNNEDKSLSWIFDHQLVGAIYAETLRQDGKFPVLGTSEVGDKDEILAAMIEEHIVPPKFMLGMIATGGGGGYELKELPGLVACAKDVRGGEAGFNIPAMKEMESYKLLMDEFRALGGNEAEGEQKQKLGALQRNFLVEFFGKLGFGEKFKNEDGSYSLASLIIAETAMIDGSQFGDIPGSFDKIFRQVLTNKGLWPLQELEKGNEIDSIPKEFRVKEGYFRVPPCLIDCHKQVNAGSFNEMKELANLIGYPYEILFRNIKNRQDIYMEHVGEELKKQAIPVEFGVQWLEKPLADILQQLKEVGIAGEALPPSLLGKSSKTVGKYSQADLIQDLKTFEEWSQQAFQAIANLDLLAIVQIILDKQSPKNQSA